MEKDGEKDGEKATLPAWLREWAMKILPWAIMGVIGASIGLYTDNIGNKKDISRNTWRNDGQDERITRLEVRQDRTDVTVTELLDNQNIFHPEVIRRLDELLEKERVRRERK